MKVIEPGHIYQLQHLDGSGAGLLVFVNREEGDEHEGTQTQDVIRVLIDRTQHCDACLRWDGNDKIVWHLRQALALHESRAIERKAAKGVIEPEKVPTAADGHFTLATPSRTFECGVCGKIDGCRCSGGRQPRKAPMSLGGSEHRWERRPDACPFWLPSVGAFCALRAGHKQNHTARLPCAQQEDNCKAADCPEHGWSRG